PNVTIVGRDDGLSQYDAIFEERFLDQDGVEAGSLKSVTVDEEGYVIASYSNDTSERVFKIPLAQFRDPSLLASFAGNVYAESIDTGAPTFVGVNQVANGKILASSLEQSTVILEEQLTNLIIAQRAYQANTNTITTSDSMLQRLDQMLR
ncbi:MAG: flagellar hook-basal body complex protein, partial [Rickettsiales bacterium]|nr:flagellar hook-basal body complex protein [Rickettsiales bacterium]